ncbi:hypothetical protein KP509_04G004400 [Ceratopteris richardii]|uniref:Uncharacterized protein n=1 Tax=Ceratopteris richardii TaxID=49495 RepID=A0A8T2UU66_CERRI|nr:hypothetical protein KP509_04G004400 [Ceratopteris richardii]
MYSSLVNNGGAFTRDSGVSSRSNISASLDDTVRNSAMAAARFQRTFLKLLNFKGAFNSSFAADVCTADSSKLRWIGSIHLGCNYIFRSEEEVQNQGHFVVR